MEVVRNFQTLSDIKIYLHNMCVNIHNLCVITDYSDIFSANRPREINWTSFILTLAVISWLCWMALNPFPFMWNISQNLTLQLSKSCSSSFSASAPCLYCPGCQWLNVTIQTIIYHWFLSENIICHSFTFTLQKCHLNWSAWHWDDRLVPATSNESPLLVLESITKIN